MSDIDWIVLVLIVPEIVVIPGLLLLLLAQIFVEAIWP